MRKYEHIWRQLKERGSDGWIVVTVRSQESIQTIINMVQNEKSAANVSRKRLDLPAYGKLEIRREPDKLRVSFRLKDSGAAL